MGVLAVAMFDLTYGDSVETMTLNVSDFVCMNPEVQQGPELV